MKTVISYAAGAALVGWVTYVMVSTDPAVRVSRTCMPLGASVRLFGAVIGMLDEDTGRDVRDDALPMIEACRSSVWSWAYDGKPLPRFNDVDPVFGDYRPRGSTTVDTTAQDPQPLATDHRHRGGDTSAASGTAAQGSADDGDKL
ncbi:hypothetical protein [Caballeronia sp. LjRoot31]|uniref:hypothetical protein n=1 Tax=Caballeronia sp. LjRoot31 TaxID=3342324 RepID=UPI003ECDA4C8